MVAWAEFASRAPELARFGTALFEAGKIASLATVTADGGPRVQPGTTPRRRRWAAAR